MLKLTFYSTLSILYITTPLAAEPLHNWSGGYVGGQINNTFAQSEIVGNRFTYNQNSARNAVSHKFTDLGFGGYLGWNVQRGHIVYGVETGFTIHNMSSNLTFNADNDIDNVKISWTGNLVGRLGYAFGNNLIYGKAGLAAAKINAVGGDVNGGNLTLSDAHIRDDIFYGPTAGIGYERFFGKAWIARIEYTYSDFGDYSQANQDGAPGSQVYQIENGPYQTVSFGLAYQF